MSRAISIGVIHRRRAERHERDDVDGPDARVLARVAVHVDLVDRDLDQPLRGAAATASCSPANVNTDRLWLASLVRSSRKTPSPASIAAAIRSTTSRRRPSETFGTDSISTSRC